MSFPELKLKITKLEKALNLTVSHVKELRTDLNMQKAVIANLTREVYKGNLILNYIAITSVKELLRLQLKIFCSAL